MQEDRIQKSGRKSLIYLIIGLIVFLIVFSVILSSFFKSETYQKGLQSNSIWTGLLKFFSDIFFKTYNPNDLCDNIRCDYALGGELEGCFYNNGSVCDLSFCEDEGC